MLDILIKNGRIFDGSGNPWTKSNIGIKDGRIQEVGILENKQAKHVIEAEGLAVTPGFIDAHVHSDLLCTQPETHKIKLLQGVTTELLGQDGLSVAPVSEETKPLWQKQLNSLNGDIGEWPWNSINEYLTFLEQSTIGGNVAYLVPHGAVRTLAMGFEGREATKDEIVEMRAYVEEGIRQGAFGFSTGLIYPPNVYSSKEELIEICKGVAKYDGCFVIHIRNESIQILDALDEAIDISLKTGVRLHISHFKVMGNRNQFKYDLALEKMELARNQGVEITFDQYPYTAGSTVFQAILPPWALSGSKDELMNRLKSPEIRNRIKYDLINNDSYENFAMNFGWENIIISSVGSHENKHFEGKSVLEIANDSSKTPEDTALDILLEEKGNVNIVGHWGDENQIVKPMRSPLYTVGSDGIFGGKPHPRLYGTFPRILGRYVREKGIISLSKAIQSMTSKPAQVLRLKDRGFIRDNYVADIVIFDPEIIADKATFEDPLQEPVGIEHVIVNGEIGVSNGMWLSNNNGKVLKYKIY